MKIPDLKLLAFDTEMVSIYGMPDPNIDPVAIISVAYFVNDKPEFKLFVLTDHEFEKKDDSRIIRDFISFIKLHDFDIIVGYNSDMFDYPYLETRCAINKIPLNIGRDGRTITIKTSANNMSIVDIVGRLNIDLYKVARKELPEVKVKKLENIAEELDIIKYEDRKNLSYKEIATCWYDKNRRSELYAYARDDVVSTLLIAKTLLPAQIYLSNLIGLPLDDLAVALRGRQVESYLMNEAHKINNIIPYRKSEGETFEGAFVLEPQRDVFNNIADIDFTSLYPSLMIKYNISNDTLVTEWEKDDDVYIIPEVGHAFRKSPDGFYRGILRYLLSERKKMKDDMKQYDKKDIEYKILDAQQYSFKILTNCFSSDTNIFTPTGIKNIKDLKIGNKVYSINPKTLDLEISNVVDTQIFFSEYINSILDSRKDLLVTDDHRFLLKEHKKYSNTYKFYTTKEISKIKSDWKFPYQNPRKGIVDEWFSLWNYLEDDSIIYFKPNEKSCHRYEITKNPIFKHVGSARAWKVIKNNIKDPFEFEEFYKGKLYIKSYKNSQIHPWKYKIKPFMELCGWFVTEGSLYKVPAKQESHWKSFRGESHKISIAQEKYRESVENTLDILNIKFYKNRKGFSFASKYIYKALSELFGNGSYNKKISKELFNYDSSILKCLYQTMMLGDGGKNRYSTVSKQLAEDFAQLCLLIGYKFRIKKENNIYRIYIYTNKHSQYDGKDIKRFEYNDLVYCITTDKNYTVLAGRNGKFEWTGQSFYGYLGAPTAKLYNRKCAESVTALGRNTIKEAMEIARQRKFDVIYGDSDSIFVKLGRKSGLKTLKKRTEILIDDLSQKFGIEIKVDEYFKSILFTGAKKRYAGINEDGKTIYRGLEIRRGDWSTISKEVQEQIIDIILKENNPQKALSYVNSIINDLRDGKIPLEKLVIWKTLVKHPNDYENSQAHVVAFQRALASPAKIRYSIGSKIPYVIFAGRGKLFERAFPYEVIDTFDGTKFITYDVSFFIDKDYYINKQIIPAANRILSIFDIQKDALGSTQQSTLENIL